MTVGENLRRWALVFATMRRRSRSRRMKNELGQSVDHFKRAASIAAQETSATVGPKLQTAVDKMQPAAVKAKGAASSGWDSALATLTPLVNSATDNVRSAGKIAGGRRKKPRSRTRSTRSGCATRSTSGRASVAVRA